MPLRKTPLPVLQLSPPPPSSPTSITSADHATSKSDADLRDSHVQTGVAHLGLYDDSWTSSTAYRVS